MKKTFVYIVILIAMFLVLGALVVSRLTRKPPPSTSTEGVERKEGIAVEVESPVSMSFTDYIVCDGRLDTSVRAMLRAQISETVEAVHVDVGDPVEEGQLLVEFRKTDILADIEARKAAHEEAKTNYERYVNLLEKGVVSKNQVEARKTALEAAAAALQRAESELKFTEVRAPIGDKPGSKEGRVRVEARMVEPGEYADNMNNELLSLVDLGKIQVRAHVPEVYVPLCTVGRTLEFRLEGEQKWRKGIIARVSPATENPNRFFDVFLAAENERNNGQWLLRPGMFAEMRLPRVTVDKALALRASAVKRDGNLEHVFVVRKGKEAAQAAQPEAAEQPGALRKLFTGAIALLKGKRASSPNPGTAAQPEAKEIEVWKAFRVPVTTGLRAEGYVQIAGGELRDGDIVVSNPRAELPDDTKVRILKRAEPLESGKKQ